MTSLIMLVEDDELIGGILRDSLIADGYHVDWHKNGLSAKQALGNTHYHLVLLDASLPGHSGLELLQLIRNTDHNTPVIVMTAQDSLESRQTHLSAGANFYLSKPFELDNLFAQMEKLITD